MGTRRRFTPEYRRDVASLVLDTGSSIASVARDLGLGESVVGRWVKLERERRQAVREGRPDPREMEAEITALRRRVRELEKENEFLGKASAFFASVHPSGASAHRRVGVWMRRWPGNTRCRAAPMGLLASAMLWRARAWMWVCVRSPRRCAARA